MDKTDFYKRDASIPKSIRKAEASIHSFITSRDYKKEIFKSASFASTYGFPNIEPVRIKGSGSTVFVVSDVYFIDYIREYVADNPGVSTALFCPSDPFIPGGVYRKGGIGTEAILCHNSTLYETETRHLPSYYTKNIEKYKDTPLSNRAIYFPEIILTGKAPVSIDVISCPLPLRPVHTSTDFIKEAITSRVCFVRDIAEERHISTLFIDLKKTETTDPNSELPDPEQVYLSVLDAMKDSSVRDVIVFDNYCQIYGGGDT